MELPVRIMIPERKIRHSCRRVLYGKQVVVVSDDKQAGSDPGIEPAMCITEAGQGIFICPVRMAAVSASCIH